MLGALSFTARRAWAPARRAGGAALVRTCVPQLRAPARCMSSFELPEEASALRDAAKAWAMDKLHPLLPRMDEHDEWPEEAWQGLASQGFLGLTVPTEYGGAGLDFVSAGLISEGINYANHCVGISHSAHDNLCTHNLFLNGTEEQRRRFLPALTNGSKMGALGMSEPGAGSDAIGSMATRAVRDGDDYILNGTKMWITNGPVADVMLVYAKTDVEAKSQGVTAFIVESDMPGFSVGKKNDKMGFRGSPQSELIFEDVRVPAANVVGGENKGIAVMMSGLDLERTFVAVGAIAVAERALDLSIEWSKQRKQFGTPIASFQLVQEKLARMYVALESSRALTYRALAMCNAVEAGGAGHGEIHKVSAAAFYAAAKACTLCCDEGVQIYGGMGFMRDTEINMLYRGTKAGEIAGGSLEIRKLIIAGELLK